MLVLVVLLATNVALFTAMGMRPAPADDYTSRAAPADRSASVDASEPSTLSSAATEAAEDTSAESVLVVYGDGYAAGNQWGGEGAAGWPALVAERLGARLELHAASQAGYASFSPAGQDYADLVAGAPFPEATVTVLFGSRNDADENLDAVRANARETVSAAQRAATGDVLVVIGPVWSSADVPVQLLAVRDIVREAAEAAGAQFVDPLADGWFADPANLISGDGVSPTDEGHARLAELVDPAIAAALTGGN